MTHFVFFNNDLPWNRGETEVHLVHVHQKKHNIKRNKLARTLPYPQWLPFAVCLLKVQSIGDPH